MSNNNHEQEIFPEAEQLIDWVNNAEIPNLIEAPENEDQGYCPCNIIEAISAFGGCLLAMKIKIEITKESSQVKKRKFPIIENNENKGYKRITAGSTPS